jgi:hypothetical protein
MYKNYFIVGWRNMVRDKGYSLLNIGGLALGIAMAMLIGLWVQDELSFNKQHDNYNQISGVLQNLTNDGHIDTYSNQSYQLGAELRNNYSNYFKRVVMDYPHSSILSNGDKTFTFGGSFMEAGGPEMLSLKMLSGDATGLTDPTSILLSSSVAASLFHEANAIGQLVKLDNSLELKVIGVYEDIEPTSDFGGELAFVAPLEIEIKRGNRSIGWGNNWLQVYVQLADNADFAKASLAIKDAKMRNVNEYDKRFKPGLFLHPMAKWHLYSEFKEGVQAGGRIELVWMFWSDWCLRAPAGMHQLHEPEYGAFSKTRQGSRRAQGRWFEARTPGETILH